MTAHCRLSRSVEWGVLTLEIQTLNRRHLEINFQLPKEFLFLDAEFRKILQKQIKRGKVSAHLSFSLHKEASAFQFKPNEQWAQSLKVAWNGLCKKLEIKDTEKGLTKLLCRDSSLFSLDYEPQFLKELQKEVNELTKDSLQALITMRKKEGTFLKKEIYKHLEEIEKLLKKVIALSQTLNATIQAKLNERLEKILGEKLELDERFYKEIAFLADKSDVSEEIARIDSHITLFEQTLEKNNQSVGKTLDFIVQELVREWNTIGSKCFDTDSSHLVINAKAACEKIREQVQNIE